MKILLVTEFFPGNSDLYFSGGVETRTYFTAKYLSVGNKVNIVCRKTKILSKQKKIGNINLYPCGWKTIYFEANLFSVFERLYFIIDAIYQGLKLDFDIVEGSNVVSYLPAYFIGLIKRKPVVAWYPDLLNTNWRRYFKLSGIFGELIEKVSLRMGWAKIIALSQSTKRKLIQAGINKTKIAVVYGGVEPEFRSIHKKLIKSTPEIKKIICISRLVKYKQIPILIEAFGLLSTKYPFLYLTIIGQGPEEKKIKQLINEKQLNHKIKLLNNLSRRELIKQLKKSYLLCLPSEVEGFGLVTIEAADLGIPFIISNIAIHKEITNNGLGGLLFKKNNIIDLKWVMEFLKQKPAKEK